MSFTVGWFASEGTLNPAGFRVQVCPFCCQAKKHFAWLINATTLSTRNEMHCKNMRTVSMREVEETKSHKQWGKWSKINRQVEV